MRATKSAGRSEANSCDTNIRNVGFESAPFSSHMRFWVSDVGFSMANAYMDAHEFIFPDFFGFETGTLDSKRDFGFEKGLWLRKGTLDSKRDVNSMILFFF